MRDPEIEHYGPGFTVDVFVVLSGRPSSLPQSRKCRRAFSPARRTSGLASRYASESKPAGMPIASCSDVTFACKASGSVTVRSPHSRQVRSGRPSSRLRRNSRAAGLWRMCARLCSAIFPMGLRTQQRETPPSALISTYPHGSKQSLVIPSGTYRLWLSAFNRFQPLY
jgi:hypothetical protein